MEKRKIAKGVRDWYGNNAILRNEVRDTLRGVFEKYGFNPLETPLIERLETLTSKGGGEIQKEVFRLKDQGNRDLALRFDQTVPLARFVATQEDLVLPFKRYAIGPVFRDGPTQPEQGRYRMFTQCDVDIVGVSEMTAEAELLGLAKDAFSKLGLGDVEVKINNRKLLDGILETSGIPETQRTGTIITLDKIDKIGLNGVRKELSLNSSIESDSINKLLKLVETCPTNEETYSTLKANINNQIGIEGLSEIRELLDYSSMFDYDFVKLDPCLARGLDYYTGTTIEVYLKNKEFISSAILAGGRYDNMVGEYKGEGTVIPAVGMSFGLERLITVMQKNKVYTKSTNTDLYLIPVGGDRTKECLSAANQLREFEVNLDMELRKDVKLKKSIKYASNQGIPYIGFIGDEFNDGKITLKELSSGNQEVVDIAKVYKIVKTEKW